MPYAVTESEDVRNLPMCKEVAEILVKAYPGYTWHVRIDGGLLIIKNLMIHHQWSMVRKYSDIAHDARHRHDEVIRAGAELLERAHMPLRGEGQIANQLEGAKKFRPLINLG